MDQFVKELLKTCDKEQLEKAIKEMSSYFSDENSTTEDTHQLNGEGKNYDQYADEKPNR